MRHHLLAFGNNALDASAGDVQLAAVADPVYSRSNSNFQIPFDHKVLWAYGEGTGLTRARIQTGSLRNRGFPQLYPLNSTALPDNPQQIGDWRDFPITLKKEEDLRVDVTNAAANPATVVIAVSPDPINFNINYSDVRLLRFTTSVTATLQTWSTPGSLTLQDTLEGGSYAICGLMVRGANVIAARLILQDDNKRPGCIGVGTLAITPDKIFSGGLGVWGFFNTYSLPQIETLESASGASTPDGWLMCAKAG